jgi:hypothetical protein
MAPVSQAHYRFPPAAAYRLNRVLFLLKSDAAVRARFLADPRVTTRELGLEDDEHAALVAADRDTLIARGAHAYLVFMADLSLRMERGTAAFEYF